MIETQRLRLRSWRQDDLDALHAICSDPLVMATLGPLLSREETTALIARESAVEAEHGHTFWAVERKDDGRLIGKCGIVPGRDGPIADKAEIGWRLASDCWGKGYITEAARGCIDWLFAKRDDSAVWAITSAGNTRSRAVMTRLGMCHYPELDFDHPRLAPGNPLRPHVAYALDRTDWGQV